MNVWNNYGVKCEFVGCETLCSLGLPGPMLGAPAMYSLAAGDKRKRYKI